MPPGNMKIPTSHDPLLFTPGPLTTSLSVKQAMLHDAGSWHFEFNARVASIRARLLSLAGLGMSDGYECVPMQGTGTFGVEAVLVTAIPRTGKVAVLSNGAYGERMGQTLAYAGINHVLLRNPENEPNDPAALDALLTSDPDITHVGAVHCETTTGILNPIQEIGAVVRRHKRSFIVDAMSSFGAIPISIAGGGIDWLISSANKCIEGVPGFSFVIARRAALLATEGHARSLSLDLLAQLKGFEKNGQFRYTPPTHSILAFEQALDELEREGGIAARGARYQRNQEILSAGMQQLGLIPFLPTQVQSPIITSFLFPKDPRFTFDRFYRLLSEKGFIIYPGKISQADTFRIGSIGRIFETDIHSLLAAVGRSLSELGLPVPLPRS